MECHLRIWTNLTKFSPSSILISNTLGGSSSIFISTSTRHSGHLKAPWDDTMTSKHFRQNVCWHGSTLEFRFNLSKHTEHSNKSFNVRSSIIFFTPFRLFGLHGLHKNYKISDCKIRNVNMDCTFTVFELIKNQLVFTIFAHSECLLADHWSMNCLKQFDNSENFNYFFVFFLEIVRNFEAMEKWNALAGLSIWQFEWLKILQFLLLNQC